MVCPFPYVSYTREPTPSGVSDRPPSCKSHRPHDRQSRRLLCYGSEIPCCPTPGIVHSQNSHTSQYCTASLRRLVSCKESAPSALFVGNGLAVKLFGTGIGDPPGCGVPKEPMRLAITQAQDDRLVAPFFAPSVKKGFGRDVAMPLNRMISRLNHSPPLGVQQVRRETLLDVADDLLHSTKEPHSTSQKSHGIFVQVATACA
jgi:hypothetical protein